MRPPSTAWILAKTRRVATRFFSVSAERHRLMALLVLGHLAADGEGPVEDALLGRRRGVTVAEDAEVDLLEHARHRAHEGRAHLAEVVLDLGDRLGEGDARALGDGGPLEDLGEDVRHRQEEQLLVRLVDGQHVAHRVALPDDVLVREDHALGRSGGARGVDEGEAVVGLDLGPALLELARRARRATFRPRRADRPSDISHALSAGWMTSSSLSSVRPLASGFSSLATASK